MAIPKGRKKKVVRRRAKTGVGAAPLDKGFDAVKYYFHNEVDKKEFASCIKTYVKNNFNKNDSKAILCNPEYKFTMHSHYACISFWLNSGLEKCDRVSYWEESLNKFLGTLVESGRELEMERLIAKKDSDKVVSLSPQQRLANKISNTIMQDLLEFEDSWIEGESPSIDLYSLFKKHGLSGSSVSPVRDIVEGWLSDYEDAYHKRCDQAVEGYSYLTRPQLNKRVKQCQEMLADLDRIKSAARASRNVRVKAPRAADKQIAKVQYKKEDSDFKIASIPPIKIVGAMRLYVFNTKYRELTEYVTENAKGFEVSGTSIKNFDKVNSRTIKLRKPQEFLPEILNRTSKQIDKAISGLSTKTKSANGRLNKDTILLRVMDK